MSWTFFFSSLLSASCRVLSAALSAFFFPILTRRRRASGVWGGDGPFSTRSSVNNFLLSLTYRCWCCRRCSRSPFLHFVLFFSNVMLAHTRKVPDCWRFHKSLNLFQCLAHVWHFFDWILRYPQKLIKKSSFFHSIRYIARPSMGLPTFHIVMPKK